LLRWANTSAWHAMLRYGLEAGSWDDTAEQIALTMETRLNTGRPMAAPEWISEQEMVTPEARPKAETTREGDLLKLSPELYKADRLRMLASGNCGRRGAGVHIYRGF
jgi:hypothetical protein